ncbi:MAG: ATP-binding cassette domain-containing protein [Candidatus Hydrogenedentes bacterium]|nr:ATP-binding cassette domain-containing protein [Candidatus Hydrogenedentota bacterium]
MNLETQHETLLSFRNVGVSYWLRQNAFKRSRHFALKDVTFDLNRGDSLGVIGRNGCGKSTLLRLLAGVMAPDHGKIAAKPGLRVSLLTLQLGFVDYLSGRENAILSGMFLGMKKRDIMNRLNLIIEFAELGDFIDQPLSTYSSGMRARLGFAVAFQMDPDIILVDEVLGVGDADFQAKSVEIMQERIQSANSTVVFVSHSAPLIKKLCNRAIWLENGVVKESGETAKVVDFYETALAEHYVRQIETEIKQGLPVFIRAKGANTIYILRDRKVLPIRSWDEFIALGGRTEAIRVVLPDIFAALQDARQVDRVIRQLEANVFCFVRPQGKKAVFAIRNGKLIPVESPEDLARLGGHPGLIREITLEQFFAIRDEGIQGVLDF